MTLFEFSDYREFIKYRVSRLVYNSAGRKKSNLAKICADLGYSSRSLLSMVMNGERLPSDEFCEALIHHWKIPKKESEYLRLQVQLDRKKRAGEDTRKIDEAILALLTKRNIYTFRERDFSMLREWHHLVIKEMVGSPGFREDPKWIADALGKKITEFQAAHSLKKMQEIGILDRDASGKLRVKSDLTETSHDIPSRDIRSHQKEMIQRALEAMEERPMQERFFNTLTLKVDPARLAELREMLLECVRKLNSDFSSSNTNSVHQINIQFFEHTNSSKVQNLEGKDVVR